VKLPLKLSVAGPSARKHPSAMSAAAGLVVLQVGVSLLSAWPLALAIDYTLGDKQAPGRLAFLEGIQPAKLLVLATAATVVLSVCVGTRPDPARPVESRAKQREKPTPGEPMGPPAG
jgi:hypothetical protein